MKKIVLKNEACIGCGACIGIDSEHFEFSDDGYSIVKSQENLDSPSLMDAIDACPVAIISLEEVEDSQVLNEESCEKENCHCEVCDCDDCDCESHECHCHDNEKAA